MAVKLVACVVQPSSLGDAVQGNANSRQPGPSTATAAASSWQTLWGATPSWASNTGQFVLSVHVSVLCCPLCCMIDLFVFGLLYVTYPDGCRQKFCIPAEAEARPCEGASGGVFASSSVRCLQLCDAPSCIAQMHATMLLSPQFCSVCCHLIVALRDNCLCRAGA